MKKIFVIMLVLSLTACLAQPGVVECAFSRVDVVSDYQVESNYKVYHDGKVVEKVENIERIISENEDVIAEFKENLTKSYQKMQDNYGGFEHQLEEEEGRLISTVIINYQIVDMELLVKNEPTLKQSVDKNNQLLKSSIIASYEKSGSICE